jgi:hypothetical protein
MSILPDDRSGQRAPASVGNWLVTLLLASIPVVGFVLLFVWAFGSDTDPGKANWAKATLIWMLFGAVLVGVFLVLFGSALFLAAGQ